MASEIPFNQVTTRGGDGGEATLFDGERRAKDDLVFRTLGDFDELASWIGVVRARNRDEWPGGLHDFDAELREAQVALSRISALIACSPTSATYSRLAAVDETVVHELELREARLLQNTRIEPVFVIPGDHDHSAEIDYARTICRRCERTLVTLIRDRARPRPDLHDSQRYLNRLSDYLFVLARHMEQDRDS